MRNTSLIKRKLLPKTVIKIKNEYKENVILNLIDKITNKEYSNISIEEFENIIPLVKGEF